MASNKKQDGDVLVVPEWGGNQPFHGRATRRNYDRQGNGNPFWCDPRDVPASRPPQVIRLLRPHEEEQRQVTVTQPVGQGGQTVDQPVVPHGVHEAAAVFPRWRVQEGRGARYTPPSAVTERPRNIQDVISLGLEDEGDE